MNNQLFQLASQLSKSVDRMTKDLSALNRKHKNAHLLQTESKTSWWCPTCNKSAKNVPALLKKSCKKKQ